MESGSAQYFNCSAIWPLKLNNMILVLSEINCKINQYIILLFNEYKYKNKNKYIF